MLTICGDGTKLPPLLIIKAKRRAKLEQKLSNLQCCKNVLVVVACNQNGGSINDIMSLWLNQIWIPLISRQSLNKRGLLVLDKASFDISEE